MTESLLVSIRQQLHVLAGGLIPKFPLSMGIRDRHLAQCVTLDPTSVPAKWHLNPSNGLSRAHECDRRQTDDRPRYREMCGYRRNRACARAIPSKKSGDTMPQGLLKVKMQS